MDEYNTSICRCRSNLHLPALEAFLQSDELKEIEEELEELRDEAFQFGEDELISAGYRQEIKIRWAWWMDELMVEHREVFAFTVYMKYIGSEQVTPPEDSFTHAKIDERIKLLDDIVKSIKVIRYVSLSEYGEFYEETIVTQMLGDSEDFLGDFIDTYFEMQPIFYQ